jgi:hypothetical protein
MGFTHAEIFRYLPVLAAGLPTRVELRRIEIGDGPQRVELLLEEERERVLSALVRIPYTPVEFVFHGHGEADVADFFTRFDRVYFKGGG